jgi:hypothetical protein
MSRVRIEVKIEAGQVGGRLARERTAEERLAGRIAQEERLVLQVELNVCGEASVERSEERR